MSARTDTRVEQTGRASTFELPNGSDATEPPEQRGAGRDDVRLLVARADACPVVRHRRFRDLPQELHPGDLLVINTSGTLPAAVDALLPDGTSVVVHVSTDLDDGTWIVEVRRLDGRGPRRDLGGGTRLAPAGRPVAQVLDEAYPDPGTAAATAVAGTSGAAGAVCRLPAAARPADQVRLPRPSTAARGVPDRVRRRPGSAEMASAGRPFTDRLLTRLITRGVTIAPLTLHAGVSSLEAKEPPLAERYDVPADTARLVNSARAAGRRVVAVGTTVVRALETVAGPDGAVQPGVWLDRLVLGTGPAGPGGQRTDQWIACAGRQPPAAARGGRGPLARRGGVRLCRRRAVSLARVRGLDAVPPRVVRSLKRPRSPADDGPVDAGTGNWAVGDLRRPWQPPVTMAACAVGTRPGARRRRSPTGSVPAPVTGRLRERTTHGPFGHRRCTPGRAGAGGRAAVPAGRDRADRHRARGRGRRGGAATVTGAVGTGAVLGAGSVDRVVHLQRPGRDRGREAGLQGCHATPSMPVAGRRLL